MTNSLPPFVCRCDAVREVINAGLKRGEDLSKCAGLIEFVEVIKCDSLRQVLSVNQELHRLPHSHG